jgi:hypothetical protein
VVRFCAPRHEKTEASWLIPIRVPNKNEILAEKKPALVKVRYAVVGLGYIPQIAVLSAFKHAHENSELVAPNSGEFDVGRGKGCEICFTD